jgi:hypothetical protein
MMERKTIRTMSEHNNKKHHQRDPTPKTNKRRKTKQRLADTLRTSEPEREREKERGV